MIDNPKLRRVFHIVGPVNLQDVEGEWIVFHPYSLSLFSAEPTEGRILKLCENGTDTKRISEILKISEGSVKDILHDFLGRIKDKEPQIFHTYEEPESMYINTGICNLRCKYCYTEAGGYGREEYSLRMDEFLIKKAIDALQDMFGIELLVFFGGEPLTDFDTIKSIVEYAEQEYGVLWGIVTNGTLIKKDIIEFLSAHNFQITVSLDGPQIVHDSNRYFPDRRGSFLKVTKFLEELKRNNIPFFVQATYTKEAFYLGYDMISIAQYLSEWSDQFVLKPACSFPLVESFVDSPTDLGEINSMTREYVRWMLDTLTTDTPMCEESMYQGLFALLTKACRTHTCPQEPFLSLFPNGELYTCHLLSDPFFCLGNFKKGVEKESIREKYQNIRSNEIFHIHSRHWYWPFQSICPSAFLTKETVLHSSDPLSMAEKDHNLLSVMWDEFLRGVITIQKDTERWNTMVGNLDKKFRGR